MWKKILYVLGTAGIFYLAVLYRSKGLLSVSLAVLLLPLLFLCVLSGVKQRLKFELLFSCYPVEQTGDYLVGLRIENRSGIYLPRVRAKIQVKSMHTGKKQWVKVRGKVSADGVAELAGLKSDVAVLKMDVENLKAATAELKDEVTGLDVRMSNMEYKFDVLTREVTQLKDNVIDLTGRTANLEKSSERTNSRLDSIEKCLQEQRESLKRIEVIHLENNLIPRVANIESCYLTTFERYKAYTDRLPELFATVSNVSRTVQAHSEAFRKIS